MWPHPGPVARARRPPADSRGAGLGGAGERRVQLRGARRAFVRGEARAHVGAAAPSARARAARGHVRGDGRHAGAGVGVCAGVGAARLWRARAGVPQLAAVQGRADRARRVRCCRVCGAPRLGPARAQCPAGALASRAAAGGAAVCARSGHARARPASRHDARGFQTSVRPKSGGRCSAGRRSRACRVGGALLLHLCCVESGWICPLRG